MPVAPDEIRTRFASALSDMYRAEVPLYGDLLRIVAAINARHENAPPRVAIERHGAIRLGLPAELALIRRLFATMGMHPVGYYDLAPAGIPVHSTAFRPVTDAALAHNPFRVFTSLLRLDLIPDPALGREAKDILQARQIVTPEALALIETAESRGHLTAVEAEILVTEALNTFRWHAEATVARATYDRLRAAHPLTADGVCFRGPHNNHLTPRTFDIDAVHAAMQAEGMQPKATIEGPPRRQVPILLRQTSFKAREEPIAFDGDPGTHTARFGEVEQRGAALTRQGRTLYDHLLAENRLQDFPDDRSILQDQDLIIETTYEDFLPVSAAGIFRSNLAGNAGAAMTPGSRTEFETALGARTQDEMRLYETSRAVTEPNRPGISNQTDGF